MTEETPIMRKIRLLMAKAQGTNNEHEAAAFAEKVQQLLLEHGLSASDIRTDGGQSRSESVQEHEQASSGRDFLKSPARRVLLAAVCKFYMCSYLRWGNERVVIIGKRSNAEVAAHMMNYLLDTTIRLSNSYASGNARIDYRRGCMTRLAERLSDLARERERAAQQPSGTGNTLPALFVSESALVQAYLKQRPGVRVGRATKIKHGVHAFAGRQAADGISLSPQVRAESNARRLR